MLSLNDFARSFGMLFHGKKKALDYFDIAAQKYYASALFLPTGMHYNSYSLLYSSLVSTLPNESLDVTSLVVESHEILVY